MTRKKERIQLAREIRKATGLKLPEAMKIARAAMTTTGTDLWELNTERPELLNKRWTIHCECCGPELHWEAVGPRGLLRVFAF